jgi:translation initiation factor IF-3
LRINHQIRAKTVRVVDAEGEMLGVKSLYDALRMAEEAGLDLVEISPNAEPPVVKISDYGKLRYDQQKKEKESKKAQVQVKVKEVKLKPNIDQHDIDTKARHAREFLSKGNKVRLVCTFRGREMVHQDIGQKVVDEFCKSLEDVCQVETPSKMMGRILSLILAPAKGKKAAPKAGEPKAI